IWGARSQIWGARSQIWGARSQIWGAAAVSIGHGRIGFPKRFWNCSSAVTSACLFAFEFATFAEEPDILDGMNVKHQLILGRMHPDPMPPSFSMLGSSVSYS
ncbi:MAG TPA: hypothetical protein PLH67_12230, partial [Lentisphaeria bacterium]|nr:hypothetical protein [Lentisphaeria bacterium]